MEGILLSPTSTVSVDEAKSEDSGVDSFIIQAEVSEVVWKLLIFMATRVDEIYPRVPEISGWCGAVLGIRQRPSSHPVGGASGVSGIRPSAQDLG